MIELGHYQRNELITHAPYFHNKLVNKLSVPCPTVKGFKVPWSEDVYEMLTTPSKYLPHAQISTLPKTRTPTPSKVIIGAMYLSYA